MGGAGEWGWEFKMFVWAAGVCLNHRLVLVCARTGKVRVKNHWQTYKCLEERRVIEKTAVATTREQRRVDLESGYSRLVVMMSFIIFVMIVYQWFIFYPDVL